MNAEIKGTSIFKLRNIVLMSLLTALVIILRFVTQGMNIPGVSGEGTAIRLIPVIVGKGLIPQFGSCTIINLLAGILITFISPSDEGLLTFLKYLTSGIMLDILYYLLKDYPRKPILSGIACMLANYTKLVTDLFTYHLVLGFSWQIIFIGFGIKSLTNGLFGFAFGYGAALIIRKLDNRFVVRD